MVTRTGSRPAISGAARSGANRRACAARLLVEHPSERLVGVGELEGVLSRAPRPPSPRHRSCGRAWRAPGSRGSRGSAAATTRSGRGPRPSRRGPPRARGARRAPRRAPARRGCDPARDRRARGRRPTRGRRGPGRGPARARRSSAATNAARPRLRTSSATGLPAGWAWPSSSTARRSFELARLHMGPRRGDVQQRQQPEVRRSPAERLARARHPAQRLDGLTPVLVVLAPRRLDQRRERPVGIRVRLRRRAATTPGRRRRGSSPSSR